MLPNFPKSPSQAEARTENEMRDGNRMQLIIKFGRYRFSIAEVCILYLNINALDDY